MSRLVYPFEDEYITDEPVKSTSITTLGRVLSLAQTEEKPNDLQSMLDNLNQQNAQLVQSQLELKKKFAKIEEAVRVVEAKKAKQVEKRVQRRIAAEARLKAYADSLDDWF